jgi:hypothetical protein
MFGLECEAPACLVALVERDCLLGHFKRAASVAALQAGTAGARQ